MTAKPRRTRPDWMTTNLVKLSWISLLQDAASEILYPILPVLLNTVLGAPAAIVGVIEGLAEAAAATTKLMSSWLNRFAPRKVLILLGYGGAALGKIIVAMAGAWPVVLVGRVVDRLGKGVRSAPRDALLLGMAPASERGRVIGFHRTADTMGAVVGPILALGLLALFNDDLRPVLWVAVIPGVISTFLVLLVKDNQPRQPKKYLTGEPQGATRPGLQVLSKSVNRAIAVIVLFSLVNFPDALLILHLSQVSFSVTEVVGLYLLFNVTYATLSFPVGMLADRFRPNQIFAAGLVCFAVAYGGLGLTNDQSLSVVLIIIYGGFAAAQDVVGKSWVAKLASESKQLAAQSRLQGLNGFSVLIAGLWAGLAWNLDGGHGSVPLMVAGVVALILAGVIGSNLVFHKHRV